MTENRRPLIRPLAAALVLAAATPLLAAFVETHVGETTVPVAAYVTQRIATLSALPAPTKAEKSELKSLTKLQKKLGKPALTLAADFAELKAAASALDKAGASAPLMKPSLDEGFVRANLSLSERVELVHDYLAAILDARHDAAVVKSLAAVTAARATANSAATAGQRAAALAKANSALTKTLKKADRYLIADRDVSFVPLTRYRSGDAVPGSGGRVAVPRDAASPLAGASVVIPPGRFQDPLTVTIEEAPSFVGGRDLAAGPAMAIGPSDAAFPADVTVFVPYQLPAESSADDLALAVLGPPQSALLDVTPGADGMLAADVRAFGTFQASIPAPPLGQPGGPYHVQMFLVNTALDSADADLGGVLAGYLDRTVSFRADHTGSMSAPNFPAFSRTFLGAAPHHQDLVQSPLDGSVDTTWTSGGTGRFALQFQLAGRPAEAAGVVSEDGRLLAFAGRGASFEFFGTGVRGSPSAVQADLAGRWAAVEFGVRFENDGAEPFTTRWFDAARTFTADAAGAIAFDAGGSRSETLVTYHTDQADAAHTRVAGVAADAGADTWTVLPNGQLSGGGGKRAGWLDAASGFLSIADYDVGARRVSFTVAVRQPDPATPSNFVGAFATAALDVGTSAGVGAAHESTHEVTPLAGSLVVADAANATLAFDAASRSVYTLTGAPPIGDVTWSMAAASVPLSASSSPLTLELDAAGNHRPAAAERWLSFSGDGKVVLLVTRGEATRLERGIGVGLR